MQPDLNCPYTHILTWPALTSPHLAVSALPCPALLCNLTWPYLPCPALPCPALSCHLPFPSVTCPAHLPRPACPAALSCHLYPPTPRRAATRGSQSRGGGAWAGAGAGACRISPSPPGSISHSPPLVLCRGLHLRLWFRSSRCPPCPALLSSLPSRLHCTRRRRG